jgi:phosphopantetheinyl transferase
VCRRLDRIPVKFWEIDSRIWRTVLAHIVLSRRERKVWRELSGPEKRRTEWLLGRVAGKDAIRLLLKKCCGIEAWPADIEIQADDRGKPVVSGNWLRQVSQAPSLSLAHTQGIVVALAVEGGRGICVGTDIECLRQRAKGFKELVLSPAEQGLISTTDESKSTDEWALRIWCAKEAVGKALGWGLPAGPRDLTACELDLEKGWVNLEVSGKLAKLFPQLTGKPLQAHTLREGDLIVASAIYRQEEQG